MPASALRLPIVVEACRFALVGVANTLLSLLVYSLLVGAGEWYPLAAALAFLAGAVNGYVWNRRWTFRRGSGGALFRYLVVQLVGLGLTEALLWLLVSTAGVEKIAGYLLTVAAVTTVTFVANRSWSFAA